MRDHQWYNNLPTIEVADKGFTDRGEALKKLAPLLAREEFRGKYDVCLVHRHVILQPGEQMVATGLVTQPEKFTAGSDTPNIVPSAWTGAGIPFEWKRVKGSEEIIAAPPPELFQEFLEIVGEDSLLGLSLVLDPVPEGQIWSEHVDHDKRQHILEIKPMAGPWGEQNKLFETCWTPKPSGGQGEPSLVFGTVCVCAQCRDLPTE
ncbi:hypothetical protein EST38_g11493 [Candolleomyces aberdarensis]|uniref:Uncharacterized protein n=1 Tax=Candolleomyces aberdarensis TaxID=2316362 RepID=A0A4Q2D4Q1_9AGAR|nr:hypothetical protein EST38_g11493 [Candolleomyces aberdarensis]